MPGKGNLAVDKTKKSCNGVTGQVVTGTVSDETVVDSVGGIALVNWMLGILLR